MTADDPFRAIHDLPGHILRRAWQSATAAFEASVGHLGVTSTQFVMLYVISLAPGLEQQEVAAAAYYDPATTGGVLSRLEKLGLIRRAPSGRSRRGRANYITPEGAKLLAEMQPFVAKEQVRVLERLDAEESATLLRLLSKMAQVGNSHSDEPARKSSPPR